MILVPFESNRRVFGGVDLSSTTDLTAFGMVQRRNDGGWNCNWLCWMPEGQVEKAEKRDGVPYQQWERDGFIRFTPGSRINHAFVARDTLELCLEYDVGVVGYDPWNAEWIMSHMEAEGIDAVSVRQGYATMTEPCKHIEAAVGEGTLKHGGNPVARWCAENIEVQSDVNANIRPVKPKYGSKKRIDLLVATITGVAVAVVSDDSTESPYDAPGGLSL